MEIEAIYSASMNYFIICLHMPAHKDWREYRYLQLFSEENKTNSQ